MITDNTVGSVLINNDRIEISFEFDLTLLDVVRTLPDRDWKKRDRVWVMPLTPWHCAQVIKKLEPVGFWIDDAVKAQANGKTPKPRRKLPDALYEYQKDGVRFLYGANGRAIVADDMGLGKTAEALVLVNEFSQKVLVVAPANVMFKWATKEVPMWAKGKSVQVITNGKQELENSDITIISYRLMVIKYEELKIIPFDTIIFDEAHALKNYKAQQTRVSKSLVKGVPHLLFLSGTPFMNRRMELFPLLNMIDPKAWSNAIEFGVRYAGGIFEHGHWVRPPVESTNTAELKERLSSIMLRRTKKEVAKELPELTRSFIPIEIENRRAYAKEVQDTRARARNHTRITSATALTLMTKLRQLVGAAKVAPALDLAEDILETGNQVVLFAHHKDVVSSLVAGLKARMVARVGIISGDTPAKERQRLVDLFLQDNFQVMIVTLAGAEGIDLYTASNIIFVEREWNAAKEEQIESRLHRNGQKNPVTAYYLVAKGTIDEDMNDLVQSKRTEFGLVVDTDVIREVFEELI